MTSTPRQALARQAQGLGTRPALLIVDMINGFTDPACPLGSEAESVIDANQVLMAAFHERSHPVYLTSVVYDRDDQASVFRARVPALNLLTRGSHWCDIDSRLPMHASDTLVEKTHASAFHGTGLAELLAQQGIDSLVVTGLTTSGCVRASAVDGLQLPVWWQDPVIRTPHEQDLAPEQGRHEDPAVAHSLEGSLPSGRINPDRRAPSLRYPLDGHRWCCCSHPPPPRSSRGRRCSYRPTTSPNSRLWLRFHIRQG